MQRLGIAHTAAAKTTMPTHIGMNSALAHPAASRRYEAPEKLAARTGSRQIASSQFGNLHAIATSTEDTARAAATPM